MAHDHRQRRGALADEPRGLVVDRVPPARGHGVENRPQARAASQPILDRIERAEQERVEGDRHEGARDQQAGAGRGKQALVPGQVTEDERELADLGEAHGHHETGADRVAEQGHHRQRHERLAEDHDAERREQQERLPEDEGRLEEHPHRHEEEHGEGVPQRKRVRRRLLAHAGLAHDHPGQEGAERHRRAEEEGGGGGHRHRQREDREREQLAGTQPGDLDEDPRHDARAGEQHQRHQRRQLQESDGQ